MGNSFLTRFQQAFQLIVNGRLDDAKSMASMVANEARLRGDTDAPLIAGLIWTVADLLQKTQQALAAEQFSQAKTHAKGAADASRVLLLRPAIDYQQVTTIINVSGGYWTAANTAEQERASAKGSDAPIVDQHRLNHEKGGVYRGIATMLMLLNANGKDPPAETRAQIQALAQGIYYEGAGTDGAGMANRLRDHGLSNATFQNQGTTGQIVAMLDKGQPVPMGVMHIEGTVAEVASQGSKRYPHLQVGSEHYAAFNGAGHWVLTVAYEGSKDNPTDSHQRP